MADPVLPDVASNEPNDGRPWYQLLNRYHWWIFVVAALGWLFDTMDQQLFTLSRSRAIDSLLVDDKTGHSLFVLKELRDAQRTELKIEAMEAQKASAKDPAAAAKAKDLETRILAFHPKWAGVSHFDEKVLELRKEELEKKRKWLATKGIDSKLSLTIPESKARSSEPFDLAAHVKILEGTAAAWGGYSTAIFLLGWATGGLIFGVLGDRWGRSWTMLTTIVLYSIFTALSAFSLTVYDFTFYRFLTGLGVGGEFAAGVALLAETMPGRARPHVLGLLQQLSAVGNICACLISLVLLPVTLTLAETNLLAQFYGTEIYGWRLVFVVGVFPALMVVLVRRQMEEPAAWKAAQAAVKAGTAPQMGSISELLGPQWRYRTLVGVLLATSGVVGLWGVAFWTPDLIRNTALAHLDKAEQDRIANWGLLFQFAGAFFGMWSFTFVATRLARRTAFAIGYVLAMLSTIMVFGFMTDESQVLWMTPILGFSTLTVFAGFAIYFPELFPTRLRSTGTGFCYNVARIVAALGPITLGLLAKQFANAQQRIKEGSTAGIDGLLKSVFDNVQLGNDEPFRYAAVCVSSIYLLGLIVLIFAPETKDRPLPE